jgi:hypothetical protein
MTFITPLSFCFVILKIITDADVMAILCPVLAKDRVGRTGNTVPPLVPRLFPQAALTDLWPKVKSEC